MDQPCFNYVSNKVAQEVVVEVGFYHQIYIFQKFKTKKIEKFKKKVTVKNFYK